MEPVNELPQVCVVDDDPEVRDLTEQVLLQRFRVCSYASATAFLADFDESTTSCITTDLRMPEVDGLQLQQRLNELGSIVSIIVLSGFVDVPTTVELMEKGAVSLLEKPYHPAALISAVERAVALTESRRSQRDSARAVLQQFEVLTDEERDVLEGIIKGLPNKAIAWKLGLSNRTVDRRRRQVLAKMNVQSPVELATLISRMRSCAGKC